MRSGDLGFSRSQSRGRNGQREPEGPLDKDAMPGTRHQAEVSGPQVEAEGGVFWPGRGHRTGGLGEGKVGWGQGLTELERCATALMCSSSSKMRSSSSSVR